MPLDVRSVGREAQRTRRTVEVIGEGLVLFTVVALSPAADAGDIVHWRLADERKPPLDVAIDGSHGTFVEVTFFISHEMIARAPYLLPAQGMVEGSVMFDLSPWPHWLEGDRYADEQGYAAIELAGSDLVLTLHLPSKGSPANTAAQVVDAGALRFVLDSDSELIGLVLPKLDSSTVELLRSAGVLDAMAS